MNEVWEEKFTVINIGEFLEHSLRISFKSKYFKYCLDILPNGEFSIDKEYKGIQVFIPPNISEDNDIYCSCNRPVRENWASFMFVQFAKKK